MNKLNIDMKYPEELVHKYGAKAGILMYVKQHLPEIPQMNMIVKTPEEPLEEFIERVYAHPISFPMIVRSSAVEEILVGSEGLFPSDIVNESNYSYGAKERGTKEDKENVRQSLMWNIERIENYPQRLKREAREDHCYDGIPTTFLFPQEFEKINCEELPDKINVIAADLSPSKYKGTLIKHPNQKDTYWINVTDDKPHDRDHIELIYAKNNLTTIFERKHFPRSFNEDLPKIFEDVKKIVGWHDQISDLNEIDKDWTYQLEFGVDPVCLYQVRPFKKIEKANFSLPKNDDLFPTLVIGITDENGIDVRVINNIFERRSKNEVINPDNAPYAHVAALRRAHHSDAYPNLQVNLLYDYMGFLAHEDVGAMRRAKITGLYRSSFGSEHGAWINVKSDGKNIRVKKIKGK